MFARRFIQQGALLLLFVSIHTATAADEFEQVLKPLFAKNCVKHRKTNGESCEYSTKMENHPGLEKLTYQRAGGRGSRL